MLPTGYFLMVHWEISKCAAFLLLDCSKYILIAFTAASWIPWILPFSGHNFIFTPKGIPTNREGSLPSTYTHIFSQIVAFKVVPRRGASRFCGQIQMRNAKRPTHISYFCMCTICLWYEKNLCRIHIQNASILLFSLFRSTTVCITNYYYVDWLSIV